MHVVHLHPVHLATRVIRVQLVHLIAAVKMRTQVFPAHYTACSLNNREYTY